MPETERERSVEELVRCMGPRMRGIARRLGVPEDESEDVVQQVFLGLVSSRTAVRDPEAWLAGATRKCCLMYHRTRRRRLWDPVDDRTLEWLALAEPPAQEQRLLRREVGTCARDLPERYRSVLRLRFALGYDAGEAALRLGYRRASIGKVTARGLRALRRAVA